jgi:glycine oxidase
VREDWRLDPAQALAALSAAARQAGARFMPHRVASRGTHDWLVVATGWSRDLAPELSHLQPIKGHILRAAAPDRGRLSLRSEGLYAVPTRDGVAIGATMEPGVREPEVDPARVAPLRDAAVRLLPGLEGAAFAAAAGIRAATPDGLPMVGASADPRVLLAAGARRNGWLLAPLVAKIVTACLTGGDPGPHARTLDPARFGPRTSS